MLSYACSSNRKGLHGLAQHSEVACFDILGAVLRDSSGRAQEVDSGSYLCDDQTRGNIPQSASDCLLRVRR
jgi:hypothetical protein